MVKENIILIICKEKMNTRETTRGLKSQSLEIKNEFYMAEVVNF